MLRHRVRLGEPGQLPVRHHRQHRFLPADATFQSVGGSPACTTSTSGSGNTEEYIDTCTITETPTAADLGSYPVTFTATPGANGGNTVTTRYLEPHRRRHQPDLHRPRLPAAPASTFYENAADSYTVECEAQSGVSGTSAYPSSIAIASGSLPADGNPTFATSTSSTPACTHATSGSGATEEYILECAAGRHADQFGCRYLPSDLHRHRTRRGGYRHLGHPDGDRHPTDDDLHGAGGWGHVHLLGRRNGRELLGRLLQQRLRFGQSR